MSVLEYGTIEGNIADVRVTGSTVTVQWKCPRTGKPMGESSAGMRASESMGGRVGASVKRSVVSEVTNSAARFLGGLMGGAAGRVVRDAAYQASADVRYKAESAIQYNDESRRAAIVQAFASVQSSFVWNGEIGRFESP